MGSVLFCPTLPRVNIFYLHAFTIRSFWPIKSHERIIWSQIMPIAAIISKLSVLSGRLCSLPQETFSWPVLWTEEFLFFARLSFLASALNWRFSVFDRAVCDKEPIKSLSSKKAIEKCSLNAPEALSEIFETYDSSTLKPDAFYFKIDVSRLFYVYS